MNRGGSRTTTKALACTCRSTVDLVLLTLFGTSLVLVWVPMMCWTPLACAAAAAAAPPSSVVVVSGGERAVNRTTVRCLPVAHDVLWKRLRLVVADFDRFRTTDVNFQTKDVNFRTKDVNDKFSLDLGHLVASVNHTNATSEPQAPSAAGGGDGDDGPVKRATTSPAAGQSNIVNEGKLPDNPAETLTPEESNRIPDDATTRSPNGDPHAHHDLHPRLDPRRRRMLLKERKVRGIRRRRRLRRRRKLLTSIFRKTSWHCHMTKYWKRMPSGIFPAYVQTARCRQRTCMLGMFECRPRRYRIKLLRRNDGACNPLPTTMTAAAETDYEETWTFVEFKVVVGCECSRKYEAGSYSRRDDRRNIVSRNIEDTDTGADNS